MTSEEELKKLIERINDIRNDTSLSKADSLKLQRKLSARKHRILKKLEPNETRKPGPKGKIKPGLTKVQSDRFRDLDIIRRSSNRTISSEERTEFLALNKLYNSALATTTTAVASSSVARLPTPIIQSPRQRTPKEKEAKGRRAARIVKQRHKRLQSASRSGPSSTPVAPSHNPSNPPLIVDNVFGDLLRDTPSSAPCLTVDNVFGDILGDKRQALKTI